MSKMTSSTLLNSDDRLFDVIQPFIKMLDPSNNILAESLNYVLLKGGGSKASLYRFEINAKSYVIRLLPVQDDPPTRMHQIMLANQAGKIGVGPKIFFVDAGLNGIVMDFIPGRTIRLEDFKNNDNLETFANLLRKLHQSLEIFPNAYCPFQRFRNFCQEAKTAKITFPLRFEEVKDFMKRIEAVFGQNPFPLVPSHLDLHPLNIMSYEHNFYFVDWVNGGISDPYYDLTTFVTFLNLSQSQTLTFLIHYFGRTPTQLELNRFIITQPVRIFVISAALLKTSTNESRAVSYEEAYMSWPLPSIYDFGENKMYEPYWKLGLAMLKAGLELIDQRKFKIALKEILGH